jgi:arylformamidase
MENTVYRHYTKAALDRNFDQRSWVANAEEVIARCAARSAEIRPHLPHQAGLRYGPSEAETLDVFTAPRILAPVLVFVHGGAWRTFHKDGFSFIAEPYAAAGIHTVILNFAMIPAVRLPEMVAQVRRAFEWVYRNAARFGGDPNRIFAAAHSSGSHLTGMALLTDWHARGLPDDIIKAATCLSGPYDLEPVMLSARSNYVKLDPAEVLAYSPMRQVAQIKRPVTVAYAEHDTDEFQRQSREFAAGLAQSGHLKQCIRLPGLNHFEGMESMGVPNGTLARAILSQILATPAG